MVTRMRVLKNSQKLSLRAPKGRSNLFFRKIIALIVFLAMIVSVILPQEALARRSSAGGGEIAEFDAGSFAMSAGMSIGTFVIGGALTSGIGGLFSGGDALGSFTNSLSNSLTNPLGTMTTGFSTFAATTQISRAFNAMGSYYEWNPQSTYLLSSIASAAGIGMINPSTALGNLVGGLDGSTLSGVAAGTATGALDGLGRAGLILAIDGDKIAKGQQPGPLAQIAGMAAGIFSTELGRYGFNNAAYTTVGPGDPISGLLNQWPKIATNALGVAAAGALGDKDNGEFIQNIVGSLAAPLLNGVVDSYRLTPALWSMQDSEWSNQMQRKYDIQDSTFTASDIIAKAAINQLYSLPAGLISMGVGAGLNQLAGDDPTQKMLVSLAGTVASGMVNGLVLASYNPEVLKSQGLQGADTATVLAQTLGSSLMHWGADTLAMGYSGVDRESDSFSWNHYLSQAYSYGRGAAAKGTADVIASHSYDVGKSIITHNLRDAASDALAGVTIGQVPLGRFLGHGGDRVPIYDRTGAYRVVPIASDTYQPSVQSNNTLTRPSTGIINNKYKK